MVGAQEVQTQSTGQGFMPRCGRLVIFESVTVFSWAPEPTGSSRRLHRWAVAAARLPSAPPTPRLEYTLTLGPPMAA